MDRHSQVSEKLSQDLDRLLSGYRAFDQRELTEGEVMDAIGRIIARKSTTDKRVLEWATNIAVVAQVVFQKLKDQGA